MLFVLERRDHARASPALSLPFASSSPCAALQMARWERHAPGPWPPQSSLLTHPRGCLSDFLGVSMTHAPRTHTKFPIAHLANGGHTTASLALQLPGPRWSVQACLDPSCDLPCVLLLLSCTSGQIPAPMTKDFSQTVWFSPKARSFWPD